MSAVPSASSVLQVLSKSRLAEIARELGVALARSQTKDAQLEALAGSALSRLIHLLGRDELKAACRAHGLEETGRARSVLIERLLASAGIAVSHAEEGRSDASAPRPGDVVQARHRQYLVEEVLPPGRPGEQTLVKMVCLDDDAQGRPLHLFWELELGARVLLPAERGLGGVDRLDEPRHFAAYLHALKWSCVTATDARLFQSPFRAGILLKGYQLVPLKKALELPRVNLFIADDVGLGKTIEAGLVAQELLLRQRADWMLVVCPASVCLQWRDEMEKRFGLRFEIFSRAFVARRRQERGFAVNPWATHNRFVISYQTLRRPEYRDPLLQHLGEKARKSLLVLDEAHTAAPASASKYAIDSRLTRVVRDVAPRFENRLFLSATPHNGHSNSFSSLLEILDRQRFTRGVPIRGKEQLDAVMVRRLKSDLREVLDTELPERKVVQIDLEHGAGRWRARSGDAWEELGEGSSAELELSELLAEYTGLMRPSKGRGRLVFVNLQKRLLSSVNAFYRTLKVHAQRALGAEAPAEAPEAQPLLAGLDEDEYGVEDEQLEEAVEAEVGAASSSVPRAEGRARELLERMLSLAEQHRNAPDAKALALLSWIRRNQCRELGKAGARWNDRRVIVFTEWGDTKKYLAQLLRGTVADTDEGDARVAELHGGMSDEARAEVQRAFNGSPEEHPVRLLVATDAAREGINLQGHCADLFHFDVPWNPARMEQRNGRIDRTLQPQKEVRCHYFFHTQRPEDAVLRTLVEKVDRIQSQLGSLGALVMDRLAQALDDGIDERSPDRLDRAEDLGGAREVARRELEEQRVHQRLRKEIDDVARIHDDSSKVMGFDPVLLRDLVDVGCELAGAKPLERGEEREGIQQFRFGEMPASWERTLDSLRPPREPDEAPWDWRKRPLLPAVFQAPDRMDSGAVHLHLSHPVVQRILSRFLAQGFSAHDLARVTVVRSARDAIARVMAIGRLTLFGPGAAKLHDELIPVAAQWLEGGGAGHLRPFAADANRRALEQLDATLRESPDLSRVSEKVRRRLRESAPEDFARLWKHVAAEAEETRHEAERKLTARAQAEADALRRILESQRKAIEEELGAQLEFELGEAETDRAQREQWEHDRRYMRARLKDIEREILEEPSQLAMSYRVVLARLVPVGLVYLWPQSR